MHLEVHACQMQDDDNAGFSDEDEEEEDEGNDGEAPDWMRDDEPLQLRIRPGPAENEEEIEDTIPVPLLPAARGENRNTLDEDYRKIGVATWNLHGLNDRRARGESYAEEVPNRLKSLARAVREAIAEVKRLHRQAAKRKGKQKAKPLATDQEIAEAMARNITEQWTFVLLKNDLSKLDQAPDAARLQDLLARLTRIASGGACDIPTANECAVLRARVRHLVGSEEGWRKARTKFVKRLSAKEKKAVPNLLAPRKTHPLVGVLDAVVALDQSLTTHLTIAHINELMAKNPWLDAFIFQEVRPDGLKLLQEHLDHSLRLSFGPCMSGVATKLNQREYYPVVTRISTIHEVKSFAIACVKDQWSDPQMPAKSKARRALWELAHDDDLGADVYRGKENGGDALDTINILLSKDCNVYRPLVVYKIETDDGVVSIGDVHTSPGDGDKEWWRYPEYDQLETAFRKGGKDGFWLMGGDYYLSAEARVKEAPTDLLVTDLEDEYDAVVELYEGATGIPVQADHTQKKRKRNEDEARELTVGQAQQAIFRGQSLQVRPDELRTDAQKHANGAPLPFEADLNKEMNLSKRLDHNASGEDIFRNVLGLTFEKVLPAHWTIAQSISGTNTHKKAKDFPAYAIRPGQIRHKDVERARRFTRARITSKMRIADFFIFNEGWGQPRDSTSLACKVGLLAPVEIGPGSGVYWYDEENLAISRYWLAISDHFPVGGIFTTDAREPVLKQLTAAPFMPAPVKPSTQPPVAPREEADYVLVPMPQDGDCFFEALKRALGLKETVLEMRQHALLEDSKEPKVYVGWPDWEALAQHYGVTIVVHEYHFGEPADRFVGLLPEVNPGKGYPLPTVHMRLIHIEDQSASHMDLLLPLAS